MITDTHQRQTEAPLVLDVSLAGSTADKTIIDADVVAPMFWGEDAHQLEWLNAVYRSGL